MNFEQRWKLRTQRDITDVISMLDNHSSLDQVQVNFYLAATTTKGMKLEKQRELVKACG